MNGELINSVILVLDKPIGTEPKASAKVLELKGTKTRGGKMLFIRYKQLWLTLSKYPFQVSPVLIKVVCSCTVGGQ